MLNFRKDEPSFSPLIGSGVSFSIGTSDAEKDTSKQSPKEVGGATLVFNNEAAITEIS